MSACHDTRPAPSGSAASAPVVALAGNPNCGKTTLFNLLTGARQHIGNWPGVTVERREGVATLHGRTVGIVDLPGVYSLLGGGGPDQAVARDVLLDGSVDLVVNIVDASNLERHLALTAELAETGRPMIVALNMVDEARAAGLEPDAAELSAALGVPVVPMVARRGTGRRELSDAIQRALRHPPRPRPPGYHGAVADAVDGLVELAGDAGGARARFEALRLLDGAAAPRTPARAEALERAERAIEAATGEAAADMVAAARYGWAHDVARKAGPAARPAGARHRITEALDRVVLSGWLGVPVFLLVLYLVFVVSFSGGNILLDFFDQASAALLIDGLGHALLGLGLPAWLVSVVAGGLGGGLNLVITFIPPIGLTFVLLAWLEDSGYMARAAYAMDRFMRRLGLPGNALVPMVIGFGCNVPAIMGSRIIDDPRGRLVTVLMQPFMSCSARLTIYMAFAVVFFRHHGGQVVFLLYLLGIVVALVTAWLLGKTALPGEPTPFVMELPPYRLPNARSVLLQSWHRLRVFLFRVGRVIAVIGVVLFVLPGIGWTPAGLRPSDVDHSLLAQGSRALTPIFQPMGIQPDNWPAVSGLIAGASAKEVVIGTFNGIYQRQAGSGHMGAFRHPDLARKIRDALATIPANAAAALTSLGDPLGVSHLRSLASAERASGADGATLSALATGFTPLSAFTYMVFVLLYVPCASTIGALRREVGWGWTTFSVLYGIAVAWGVATVIYQAGTFGHHPAASALWIGGVVLGVLALVTGLRWYGLRSAGVAPPREAYS